jgi:hypothetical protein
MADTTRDIELRLRARDLSTAELKTVIASVNELSRSLDTQLAAASRLEVKEKELRSTLQQLDQAAKAVSGLDALIQRSKILSDQVEKNRADLERARVALESHQAAMAAGTATGRNAEAALAGFQRALTSAQAKLQQNSNTLAEYHARLSQAGVSTTQLAEAERQLATTATAIGDARTKLNNTIRDYPRLEREAKEAAQASVKASRDAAEAAKAEAAARKTALDALRAQVDQSLRDFNTRHEVNRKQVEDLRKFNEDTKRLTRERREGETREARATADAIRNENRRRLEAQKRDEETGQRELTAVRNRFAATSRGAGGAFGGVLETGPVRGAGAPIGFLGLRPYELTNLGYQINDVVSGLVSGQNATQILAQQGGQFIQIFGRAALRWFPLVAAGAGAVALAIGGITNAVQTMASNRDFEAALQVNTTASDLNAKSLTALRKELRDLGVDWGDAGKAIRVAMSANVRPEFMREFLLSARSFARVEGIEVAEAAKVLADGISGSVEEFDKLAARFPTINDRQREYVRELIRSGQQGKAQIEILRLVGEAYKNAEQKQLSQFQQATEKLAASWKRLMDRMGESDAIQTVITRVTELVQWLNRGVEAAERLSANELVARRLGIENVVRAATSGAPGFTMWGVLQNLLGLPSPGAPGAATAVIPPSLTGQGAANATIIQAELTRRGYTAQAMASIMGNLQQESGFIPTATGPLGHRGIAQWDQARRAPLGGVFTDLMAQIDLLDRELRTLDPTFREFTGSVAEGAKRFRDVFERPIPRKLFGTAIDIADLTPRIQYAQSFLQQGLPSARGPSASAAERGVAGPGSVTGPRPEDLDRARELIRVQKESLDVSRASSRLEEENRVRQQALIKIRETIKEVGTDEEQAQARRLQNEYAENEVLKIREQRRAQDYERQLATNRQIIQDGKDRLQIEEAGAKVVDAAWQQGIRNYDQLVQIRERGEAEQRANIAKRRQEQDQLDATEKRVDDIRRENLRQQKSAIDQITEAINLRYDNEIKAIEKVRERSSEANREQYDAQIRRLEAERQVALVRAPREAAEQQARDALAARNDLVQTYTKLEAVGEITVTEKEARIKEAYGATRQAILQAADALEQYIRTAKDLPETEVMRLTARVKELRAETKYIDPFWKGLKETFSASFTQGLDTAFNTIAEAIGGAIAKTKEWKDVWTSVKNAALNFFASILKELASYILKAQAAKLASSLFGGGGGGLGSLFGGGASAATSAAGVAGSASSTAASTGIFGLGFFGLEKGGVAGRVPPSGIADPSWWAGAPRYRNGAIVGLAPDEQRAILHRGEEVLSADNPRNILNGGGRMGDVHIRNVLVDDQRKIAEAMQGAHGERVIVQTVIRNGATIRELLRG